MASYLVHAYKNVVAYENVSFVVHSPCVPENVHATHKEGDIHENDLVCILNILYVGVELAGSFAVPCGSRPGRARAGHKRQDIHDTI